MNRIKLVDRLLARAIGRDIFKEFPRRDEHCKRDHKLADSLARFGVRWEVGLEAIEAVRGGSKTKAESVFSDSETHPVGIDVTTIILIIKLILALWDYWMNNSVWKPSVVPVPGEPGSFDLDEEIEVRV